MQTRRITRSTGPRRQWLTESQTVLPGWSRRLYTSTRKVHNPWIAVKAAINSVTHTTTFLARQVQVLAMPRTGRTSTSFFFWWKSLIETETSTKSKNWLFWWIFKCIPYNNICMQNFIQIGLDLAVRGPKVCFEVKTENGQVNYHYYYCRCFCCTLITEHWMTFSLALNRVLNFKLFKPLLWLIFV